MTTMLPASAAVMARIRKLRELRSLTQKELAQRITAAGYPVGRVALAQSEVGSRKEIPIDFVLAAAAAFDVPIETLLHDPDCPQCSDAPPDGFSCLVCGKASA